ncbi:MAG TPA: toll/interleukin-1 receptor domain-containing protein [Blastocatellia bacterium]|jgi:hypothetical protein|nr:toll/interleukin-1 receptor domain-containing protein [Blastocatellia bacterium]
MSVYISYSFKDAAYHSMLCMALEGQKIPFWNPKAMKVGESLRDQLLEAINTCDVCIFLATGRSIESDWCAAEVGAFWGAGKRVIMYLADPDLEKDKIPPQLREDLWTSDVYEVVRVVQQDLSAAVERKRQEAARRPRLVSEMTIATLYDVIASLKSQFLDKLTLPEAMRLIQENISINPADAEAVVQPLIKQLVGIPREIIEETAGKYWPATFILKTNTGEWLGFARSPINHPNIDGYTDCLILLCDAKLCVAAAAVSAVRRQDARIDCDSVIANFGETPLGEAKHLSAR